MEIVFATGNPHKLQEINEICYLTKEEIIKMTEICNDTFVNFIKTSTGFGTKGAELEDVELINEHKNEILEIKASGGIKTSDDAIKFINAGATRLGTSSGVEIMKNCDCKEDCKCHEHENCKCKGE